MDPVYTQPDNLTEQEFIEFLQRWVLVHSWLYYEGNESIVRDSCYDRIAKQLVELQKNFPGNIKDTFYGYVFYDFDGTTGFDLYHRLNDNDKKRVIQVANNVLRAYRKDSKKRGER